ncbi:MAG: hypothetical protein ACE5K4_03025 [Candidatus Hydrothermarchaeota archaeon]
MEIGIRTVFVVAVTLLLFTFALEGGSRYILWRSYEACYSITNSLEDILTSMNVAPSDVEVSYELPEKAFRYTYELEIVPKNTSHSLVSIYLSNGDTVNIPISYHVNCSKIKSNSRIKIKKRYDKFEVVSDGY